MDDCFPATIGRINTDGSYEVMYDDDVAQAQRVGHTVERYRKNQADTYPDLYTAVELDSLRVRLPPIIDSAKLEQELLTAKPLLVRLKQQGGRVKDREFAKGLIVNDDLPETAYPELRKLVKIMLTLPATSVQCERDFSAINRLKVKGRARLGHKKKDGITDIAVLDRFMRVYSLPRAVFFAELDKFGKDQRADKMRKDPVTYLMHRAPSVAPCTIVQDACAAWVSKRDNSTGAMQETQERRGRKRSHEQVDETE